MPMTRKELRHLEQVLKGYRKSDQYFTVWVDGEARRYRLSRMRDRSYRTFHGHLGPRYRHARLECVRIDTPYKNDAYEWVDGRAVVYHHVGRTRGEVLRVLVGELRKRGAKDVRVVR